MPGGCCQGCGGVVVGGRPCVCLAPMVHHRIGPTSGMTQETSAHRSLSVLDMFRDSTWIRAISAITNCPTPSETAQHQNEAKRPKIPAPAAPAAPEPGGPL